MIPASGAGGREFDSRITPFFCSITFFVHSTRITHHKRFKKRLIGLGTSLASMDTKKELNQTKKRWKKSVVRTGTRTQNLLLRRQAPYPLGHTDIDEIRFDPIPLCTCHSSLGVEHPLSKRKVVGSNPACGSPISFFHRKFFWEKGRGRKTPRAGSKNESNPVLGCCIHPENPRLLL
jgi:hypothetical protein